MSWTIAIPARWIPWAPRTQDHFPFAHTLSPLKDPVIPVAPRKPNEKPTTYNDLDLEVGKRIHPEDAQEPDY